MISDWYEEIEPDDKTVTQGDLFKGVRALNVNGINIPLSNNKYTYTSDLNDLIILTQSCDLQRPYNNMLVTTAKISPLYDYFKSLIKAKETDGKTCGPNELKSKLTNLVKNQITNLLLLPEYPDEDFYKDYLIVSFNELVIISYNELQSQIEKGEIIKRVRLKSPYREFLSSSFAFSFSRVALASRVDIPEENDYYNHIIKCVKEE